MSIATLLSIAQGGQFFINAGTATNLSAAEAEAAIAALAPAIAQRLKDKAAKDPDAFDALLDMLEAGAGNSELENPEADFSAEAIKDGVAILDDLYGSSTVAMAVLSKLAPKLPANTVSKIAAISATSVLAALVASPTSLKALSVSSANSGRGILNTFISALLAALVRGILNALQPKRRRNYRYGRRTATRRRTVRPNLESIFREILAPK